MNMPKYAQLNLDERMEIYMKWMQGCSKASIARDLGRNRSTISRELLRNESESRGYLPKTAHTAACTRRYKQQSILIKNDFLRDHVIGKLKIGWSPESIAGRLKFEQTNERVCSESIYQFIYSKYGQRKGLYKALVRKHAKRNVKYSRKPNKRTIPDLVSISERPELINQRAEIGHMETDLVFCRGSQSANILTSVDRKTRFIILAKNKSKKADLIVKSFVKAVEKVPGMIVKSSTFDQGKEFSRHALLRVKFGIQTFFCNPHSPWQKGQIENANGRLRYFLPRRLDLKSISEQRLNEIQDLMNNQPRKCLGYRTPSEVFFDELAQSNRGYCCV